MEVFRESEDMKFHPAEKQCFLPGQLVEFNGLKQRNMSILAGGKLTSDCHTAIHGELFLFVRPWNKWWDMEWGVFLVGERYVVERCHCFYPLKSQA